MAWRDQLRPGSFRGVKFLVDRHEHEFGRRLEMHEFPLRDTPFTEDLGEMGRKWTVECYVIGADYMTGRDALVKACRAPGSGTLIHPYLGTLTVMCGRGRVGETKQEGGMARFQLEFLDAGQANAPVVLDDTSAISASVASVSKASLASTFGVRFSTTGAPPFVQSSLADLVGKTVDSVVAAAGTVAAGIGAVSLGPGLNGVTYAVVSTLTGALRLAGQGKDGLSDPGAAIYALAAKASAIKATAPALLASPGNLASAVSDLVDTIPSIASQPARAFVALMGLTRYGSGLQLASPTTPWRARQLGCQQQIVRLVQQLGGVGAAAVSADMDLDSREIASAARTELGDGLDGLIADAGDAGDDDAFEALRQVRLAAMADITARGASLARLSSVVLPASQPALVVAYRLYGDAARADEIALRNGVPNLGFLPGGVAHEVLSA